VIGSPGARPSSTGARRAAGAATAACLAATIAAGASCEDRSYRDIGAQINVLTKRTDSLVPRAQKTLAEIGRKAIPQIETALHTAPLAGRLNLLGALERIGDPEAIPVLRHLAIYDPNEEVRRAAETLLGAWAGKTNPRGDRARVALARVATLRASGEKPLPPIE
jgi:hypothetical protein